jgi:hypothetical protein
VGFPRRWHFMKISAPFVPMKREGMINIRLPLS